MKTLQLSENEINAILKLIEFHTESFADDDSADELNELMGTDVDALYEKLIVMGDHI